MKFMLVSCLLTLVPGPSMIVILKNTIAGGLSRGMEAILGVVTGDAILLLLILTGVGAAIQASPILLYSVQIIGALYLICLGLKELLYDPSDNKKSQHQCQRAYVEGVSITLMNPKIIVFLIAFFPQFMVSDHSVISQLLVMGPLFLLVVLLTFSVCAVGSHWIRKVLASEDAMRWVNTLCAFSLIVMGVVSILSR